MVPAAVPNSLNRVAETQSRLEWAEMLARLLDDAVRIPGTRIRIGLDAIIGFFLPGVGDAATAALAVALLGTALRRRVPPVIIGRMVLNIAVDALVGTIPVIGDLFDVGWKANRKNVELVRQHQSQAGYRPRPLDYVVVFGAIALIIAIVCLPILVTVWLISRVFG